MSYKIIHEHETGKWYFWNETWSIEHGPYDTEEKAKKAWQEYCKELEEYCGDELSR